MAYGLTDDGFVMPTLNELIDEHYAEFRAAYGENVDLTAASPFGQEAVIRAEREFLFWQALQATYRATDPDAATGASLDNVGALTGTRRDGGGPSEVTGTLTGTAATVVPEDSAASVVDTGARFVTLADATLVAVTAWTAATSYPTAGARHKNSSNVYEVVTPGTSAGSGGPSTTGDAITDNTVVWKYLGPGVAAVDVEMASEESAPILALSRTLTVIETPISGWAGVINNLDATLGASEENDATLRLRREDELRAPANAALDAIRAKVLLVDDVTQVTVFENVTDTTDGDGIPPHAVEALVVGGDDQDIYDALLAAVAGGIRSYGTETGAAEDAEGTSHVIQFSRPTEITIYVTANLIVNANEYPLDGDTQVEEAIVAYGDAQRTGKNVVASRLEAACFEVPGVLEAECLIKITASPTLRTTIAISLRQLAVFDTSRITVNATPGTP